MICIAVVMFFKKENVRMKKTGEICKIDNLGRIVIPVKLRKEFDLEPGTPLEIFYDDEGFFIKRYIPVCVFCGSEDDLTQKNGKCICAKCIGEFTKG